MAPLLSRHITYYISIVSKPFFDLQVVVVYYKKTRRPKFKPPPALASLLKLGTKFGNQLQMVDEVDIDPEDDDEGEVRHGLTCFMLDVCLPVTRCNKERERREFTTACWEIMKRSSGTRARSWGGPYRTR